MSEIRRVAIMTGGGDCPGLNAAIRGAVLVGKERFGWEIFGVEDAFHGLVDLNYRSPRGNRWLEVADVRGILERGGTILGTSNRSDPFHYVVRDANGAREVDVSHRVMENYEALKLDALISIGGDGSMRIANIFSEKGMNVVGLPKTIDNDLAGTEQTFGFDTAVNIATEALDRLRDTAESHDRILVVEVMGRDAGWIALHAGLAGGADAILIPEIPYSLDPVGKMLEERRRRGKNYSLVVVAEGAKPHGGEASKLDRKLGEMPRLMGAGARVAEGLSERMEADVRVVVLGHVQRGGTPSSFDRILATRYGVAAAEQVQARNFGTMVSLQAGRIVTVSLREAVEAPRLIDPKGELVTQAKALGVAFGD